MTENGCGDGDTRCSNGADRADFLLVRVAREIHDSRDFADGHSVVVRVIRIAPERNAKVCFREVADHELGRPDIAGLCCERFLNGERRTKPTDNERVVAVPRLIGLIECIFGICSLFAVVVDDVRDVLVRPQRVVDVGNCRPCVVRCAFEEALAEIVRRGTVCKADNECAVADVVGVVVLIPGVLHDEVAGNGLLTELIIDDPPTVCRVVEEDVALFEQHNFVIGVLVDCDGLLGSTTDFAGSNAFGFRAPGMDARRGSDDRTVDKAGLCVGVSFDAVLHAAECLHFGALARRRDFRSSDLVAGDGVDRVGLLTVLGILVRREVVRCGVVVGTKAEQRDGELIHDECAVVVVGRIADVAECDDLAGGADAGRNGVGRIGSNAICRSGDGDVVGLTDFVLDIERCVDEEIGVLKVAVDGFARDALDDIHHVARDKDDGVVRDPCIGARRIRAEGHVVVERKGSKRGAVCPSETDCTRCVVGREVDDGGSCDVVDDFEAVRGLRDGVDIELVAESGVTAIAADLRLDVGNSVDLAACDEREFVDIAEVTRVDDGVRAACIQREVRGCDVSACSGSSNFGEVDRNGLRLFAGGDGDRVVRAERKDDVDDAVDERSIAAVRDGDCRHAVRKCGELECDEARSRGAERFLLRCGEHGCRTGTDDVDAVLCSVDCIVEGGIGCIEHDAALGDGGSADCREAAGNDRDLARAVDRAVRSEVVDLTCELDVEGIHACLKRLGRKVDSRRRDVAFRIRDVDISVCVVRIGDRVALAHGSFRRDARRVEHLAFGLDGRIGKFCREAGDVTVHDRLDVGDLIGDLLAVSDDLVRRVGNVHGIDELERGAVRLGEVVTDGHDAVERIVVRDDERAVDEVCRVPVGAAGEDFPKGAVRGSGAERRRIARGRAPRRDKSCSRRDDPCILTGKGAVRAVADTHEGRVPRSADVDRKDLHGERTRLTCNERAVVDVILACDGSDCGRVSGHVGERRLVAPSGRRDRIGEAREALTCSAAGAGVVAAALVDPVVLDRDFIGCRHGLSAICGRLIGRDDDLVGTRAVGIVSGAVHLILF